MNNQLYAVYKDNYCNTIGGSCYKEGYVFISWQDINSAYKEQERICTVYSCKCSARVKEETK